jgi:hypothetical protein
MRPSTTPRPRVLLDTRSAQGPVRRILPLSFQLPVAATEGSVTRNLNKTGVRLWTGCSHSMAGRRPTADCYGRERVVHPSPRICGLERRPATPVSARNCHVKSQSLPLPSHKQLGLM